MLYSKMEEWVKIRQWYHVEHQSKREILRRTGMHWQTLEKILEHPQPPGYRQRKSRPKPKLEPYLEVIEFIVATDKERVKKQRHTAKRIYERLQELGYTGKYTVVKDAVRELKRKNREVFIPLIHRPGEAQVDFGSALVRMAGELRRVSFFVMCLPHSDAMFVMACERECTESFWEGHVRAFEFFGLVPRRITYDNSRVMIRAITGKHQRELTTGFLQLQSHYLFEEHFCCVRRANEKGVVEGAVKYCRLNFLVPVPEVRDFAELNEHLAQCCRNDLGRKLRGREGPKEQLLVEDRSAGLRLPATPFDACEVVTGAANSLSLVRYDRNDYSVPSSYAHHEITIKGYLERVVLCCGDQEVAEHRRLWGQGGISFNPVHYLAVLEGKPGALDYARPLEDWDLPECFGVLRRRLETEWGHEGTREFIRVLRLLEDHPLATLTAAVEKGLRVGGYTREAMAQFLSPQRYGKPPTFSLAGREHLAWVTSPLPELGQYNELRVAGGVQ